MTRATRRSGVNFYSRQHRAERRQAAGPDTSARLAPRRRFGLLGLKHVQFGGRGEWLR